MNIFMDAVLGFDLEREGVILGNQAALHLKQPEIGGERGKEKGNR
jgi:hypothetical protein